MTNVFIRKQNQAHEHRFVMAVPKQKSARNAVCGGRQSGLGCVGDCHQLIPMLVKILINNPCHPHKKNPDIRVTQVRIMTRSPDYQRDGITLYLGDCGELLPQMEPGAIGAVITSPPYNLGGRPWPHLGNWKPGQGSGGNAKWRNGCEAGAGVQYGLHKDNMNWEEYVAWQHSIIGCLWELLPGDGAIFYNHKPRVIGAKLWTPMELITPDGIWCKSKGESYFLSRDKIAELGVRKDSK